jgi:lantibiotic modifying enzyme
VAAGLAAMNGLTATAARRRYAALVDASAGPPFAEVLAPLVAEAAALAVRQLEARGLEPPREGLTGHAGALLGELSGLSARVLDFEVRLSRAAQDPAGPALLPTDAERSRGTDRLLGGGLADVLARHTALGCLVGWRLHEWAAEISEVMVRAADDAPLLSALLGDAGATGRVVRLESTLGDRHDGRRTLVVWFDAGPVMYKPRDVRVDEIVARAAAVAGLDLRFPRVVARAGWGWTEHIAPRVCGRNGDAALFYRRAGQLAALARVLGVGDLHAENLVTAGAHPVPVDLECSFGAALREGDASSGSLLDSLLLPRWERDHDGTPRDLSGLGADRGPSDPLRHRRAMEAGLAEAHLRLSARRQLVAEVLEDARGVEVRHILRATGAYMRALRRSLEPRPLARLDARRAAFDHFASGVPATWAPLTSGEIAALVRGDVPRVVARAGGVDLRCGDHVAPGVLERSGVDAALDRLARLGPRPARLDSAELEAAFALRGGRGAPGRRAPSVARFASELAEGVAATAPTEASPRVPWTGAVRDAHSGTAALEHLGPTLYDGLAGVALMHAGAARALRSRRHADLARAAARRAVLLVGRPGPHSPDRLGAGGFAGIASVLYGVTAVAVLLGADDLLTPARELASETAAQIRQPGVACDVVDGLAGALLALLAHAGATGERASLDAAQECGRRLVERAEPAMGGLAWPALGGTHLGGFGHGACGVAVALGELWARRPRREHAQVVAAALAFEDALRLPGGGWRDLREGAAGVDFGGWCHGAAGAGLARMRLRELGLASGEGVADAASALAGPPANDTMCCGTCGRVELLVRAGRALGRSGLVARGTRALRALAAERIADTDGGAARGFDRGLMRGHAGVAWTAWRVAGAGALPDVLLLRVDR